MNFQEIVGHALDGWDFRRKSWSDPNHRYRFNPLSGQIESCENKEWNVRNIISTSGDNWEVYSYSLTLKEGLNALLEGDTLYSLKTGLRYTFCSNQFYCETDKLTQMIQILTLGSLYEASRDWRLLTP